MHSMAFGVFWGCEHCMCMFRAHDLCRFGLFGFVLAKHNSMQIYDASENMATIATF